MSPYLFGVCVFHGLQHAMRPNGSRLHLHPSRLPLVAFAQGGPSRGVRRQLQPCEAQSIHMPQTKEKPKVSRFVIKFAWLLDWCTLVSISVLSLPVRFSARRTDQTGQMTHPFGNRPPQGFQSPSRVQGRGSGLANTPTSASSSLPGLAREPPAIWLFLTYRADCAFPNWMDSISRISRRGAPKTRAKPCRF